MVRFIPCPRQPQRFDILPEEGFLSSLLFPFPLPSLTPLPSSLPSLPLPLSSLLSPSLLSPPSPLPLRPSPPSSLFLFLEKQLPPQPLGTPFPTNLVAAPQSSENGFAESVFLEKFSNPVAVYLSLPVSLSVLSNGDRKYSSPLYSKSKRILASVGKANVSTAPPPPPPHPCHARL